MKHQCLDCNRTFLYAATCHSMLCQVTVSGTAGLLTPTVSVAPPVGDIRVETRCCPFCKSLNIDEVSLEQAKIVSVVSVAIEDVDAKLKEGYVVHELYAKTATLVKREKEASNAA
jgi:hypothetical protein